MTALEALKNFLQFSTPLDWLVITLAVILILAGILMLFVVRSRRVIYCFLAAAFLPLLLGIMTAYLKNRAVDKALAMVDSGAVEAGQEIKQLPPPPPPPPPRYKPKPTPTPAPTPEVRRVASNLAAEGGRREAWISTYVGAAGTSVAVLIGLFGLALKGNRKAGQEEG